MFVKQHFQVFRKGTSAVTTLTSELTSAGGGNSLGNVEQAFLHLLLPYDSGFSFCVFKRLFLYRAMDPRPCTQALSGHLKKTKKKKSRSFSVVVKVWHISYVHWCLE